MVGALYVAVRERTTPVRGLLSLPRIIQAPAITSNITAVGLCVRCVIKGLLLMKSHLSNLSDITKNRDS